MNVVIAAAGGLCIGFLIRISTPLLAGVKHEGKVFRWPWVEFLTAAAAALTEAFDPGGPPWHLFVWLLVAITSTDFLCKLIPDRITFPGAVVGVGVSALWWETIAGFLNHDALLSMMGIGPGPLAGVALSLLGAAVGFGILELFRRVMGAAVGMEVMGMGDSKLLMLAGAWLGPSMVLLSIAPGLLCGLVMGVLYTRITKTPHLPFGPALCAGAFVTLLWGDRILAAWTGIGETMRTMPRHLSLALTLGLLVVAVLLLVRVRRRRAEYTKMIEEEYDSLEDRD